MAEKNFAYLQILIIVSGILLFPSTLHAHIIPGSGMVDGLIHPLFGIDHLLAMIGVGIMGARIGGISIFLIPATFLFSMIIGICTPFLKIWSPFVEAGISSSLLFFGIYMVIAKNISLLWAIGGTAFFAFFHGHSHGEELLFVTDAAAYYLGLIVMTAILHFSGVMIGVFGKKYLALQKAIRFSGIAMCAFGISLLFPNLLMIINRTGS